MSDSNRLIQILVLLNFSKTKDDHYNNWLKGLETNPDFSSIIGCSLTDGMPQTNFERMVVFTANEGITAEEAQTKVGLLCSKDWQYEVKHDGVQIRIMKDQAYVKRNTSTRTPTDPNNLPFV